MNDGLICCASCGRKWPISDCAPLETILCECGRGIVVPEVANAEQIARDLLATEYETMEQAGSTAIAADIRAGVDSGYSARIALRAVTKALALHPSQGDQWRGIESAPRDGTPVLLFAKCKGALSPCRIIGWFIGELGWIELAFTPNNPVGLEPTHWMLLPSPPSRQPEGE